MERNVGSYAWYPSVKAEPNWIAWYPRYAAAKGAAPRAVSQRTRGERRTSNAAANQTASPGRVTSAQPIAAPPRTGHALDPERIHREVVANASASHIVAGVCA